LLDTIVNLSDAGGVDHGDRIVQIKLYYDDVARCAGGTIAQRADFFVSAVAPFGKCRPFGLDEAAAGAQRAARLKNLSSRICG